MSINRGTRKWPDKKQSKLIYIYIYHSFLQDFSLQFKNRKKKQEEKEKERHFIREHIFKFLWFDRDNAQIGFFFKKIFLVVWTLTRPYHLDQAQPLDVWSSK